eukprot:TRINITY_DN20840_c1_g3_i1.p1 TRINITY_DN20840_c1_g3~~TRINITY_DN20840_c1_g3_i1.p1  ORF type:complete len:310 (+),score=93.77 TRINITY_DN20840_c1_g3_i1:61-930(+)
MAVLLTAAALGSLLSRHPRHSTSDSTCKSSACCGMAVYPVGNAVDGFNTFYSEMKVPGLPENVSTATTDYLYFNIFFDPGVPNGIYNQFVPQLMLGDVLDSTSGPPVYWPEFHMHHTWVFGAQYYMSIYNATNQSTGHAATGPTFACEEGEVLFTNFQLDSDFVWTLTMGVKGDDTRLSTLRVEKPYMGLLDDRPGGNSTAPRWSDVPLSTVHVNSCWEMYNVQDREHYPSTGTFYDMWVDTPKPDSIAWQTNWTEIEVPTCPGAPRSSIGETHNGTRQLVTWNLTYDQ